MEKIQFFCKSFQTFSFERLDSDNIIQETIFCEDDGEDRIYCNIGEKLCIERFLKNHLKSQADTNNIR